jgi:hypothetical protein
MAGSLRDINKAFIKVEELNVRIARRFVGVGFVLCAVAVSIVVFYFAKKSDDLVFEDEVREKLYNNFSFALYQDEHGN